MNVLCRGCRTEIDLNAGMCPICLRPRDRSEMLEDAKNVREASAEAKRRPFKLAAAALALGAAGWAGWTFREPLRAVVDKAGDTAGDMMDHASDPKTYAPSAQTTPEAAPGEAPAPASAPPPQPAAPGPAGAAAPPPAPAAVPAEPPVDWEGPRPTLAATEQSVVIYGWVYDLRTARPLPGFLFHLRDRMDGGSIPVNADHRGWYQVLAPRQNSGLVPEAAMQGYRRETLAENEPPWHARKPAARKRAAAERPDQVLLILAPRQDELEANIVVLPDAP